METYGCQMNVNDTEIAWSILKDAGYLKTADAYEVSELEDATDRLSYHFYQVCDFPDLVP